MNCKQINFFGFFDYDKWGAKGEKEGAAFIAHSHEEWVTRTFPSMTSWHT